MLKDVELPFYPSATNCLIWSKDGELACTAGEHIHLLIPERKVTANSKGVQNTDPWAAVRFRVNSFTTDEWPMQEPLSFEDFSIGEEQSVSTVTAISWSAPGLGKHRRSVLAVLTSNLILSIWESKSDPKKPESWERVLIVNHSLRDYFSSHADNTSTPNVREGSLRQRTRIRAFAWADPLRSEGNRGQPSYQSKWGVFVLAVTNDNGEIFILHIISPYNLDLGQATKWHAMLCWHDKARPATQAELQPAQVVPWSLLSAVMAEQRFVRDLMWDPWIDNGKYNARLTYTWGAQFHCLKVTFSLQSLHITATLEGDEESSRNGMRNPVHTSIIAPNNCPMLSYCYQQADHRGVSTLVTAIAVRDIINVRVIGIGTSLQSHTHDLYDHQLKTKGDRWMTAKNETNTALMHPWDQVSGLALCKEPDATEFYLYITTQLSHLEVLKYTPSKAPKWNTCADTLLHRRMADCRMMFDQRHDLGGLSVMKTWGLASLGVYVAACVTVHPGDMVEYTIQSLERSTMIFGAIDNQERRYPWERVTEHAITKAEAQARILDTIFAEECDQDGVERSVLTNRIIYAAACASMQLRDPVRLERLERAKKALGKLESMTDFSFGSEIACIERLLTMKDADFEEQASEIRNSTRHISEDRLLDTPAASCIHEMCSICGESIVWDSFETAGCAHGHTFVRCALTFLTIQEPGISKYCESCDREYLDEQILLDPTKRTDGHSAVMSQDPLGSEESITGIHVEGTRDIGMPKEKDHSGSSLARVLLSIYDECAYCGGKFVG